MPRGQGGHGGRRISLRPDAKKAGRPKGFATVRIPIAQAPALLTWLMEQHDTMDAAHPAESGMAFLIAGLWSEVAKAPDQD